MQYRPRRTQPTGPDDSPHLDGVVHNYYMRSRLDTRAAQSSKASDPTLHEVSEISSSCRRPMPIDAIYENH